MEEESEYKKLSCEDKCVHKLWKARVAGYEEAAQLFRQLDDEKSPEWNKFLPLLKKMVQDSNAVAQEKGLEACLACVENCPAAGKAAGEIIAGAIGKGVAAPRTRTRELAVQLLLALVEAERHELVQEELLKGAEHKNPRIASACVSTLTQALRLFGNKVVSIKLLVKKAPALLADRDKDVRTESKALVVEMHRWIGAALEPHLSQLQPVVLQELRDAFGDAGKASPERYLRSQRPATQDTNEPGDQDGGEEGNDEEDAADAVEVDPYELMDPVDILSKLPKDFYEKLEAKKWQERKEALDALEALLKAAPKLEQGDYGDLVRAMKKVISKDSNVLLVALSIRCVSLLALGLQKRFSPYCGALLPACLDKFKEKKPNVVQALREATDNMYPCTNIEAMCEDVVEALNNKNPAVKAETAGFLARALARTQPSLLTKKLLKAYVGALLKVLESADPIVRDQAAEALGTAQKLVGEKNISPFIGKLDNLKEQKILECCEKAVLLVKVTSPKKEARPKTAPAAATKAGSSQPKPVKRPATGGAAKKPAPAKKAAPKAAPAASREPAEREMSPDEAESRAQDMLPQDIVNGLSDANWKTRMEAAAGLVGALEEVGEEEGVAQVLLRTLVKKPGLKDTNFQALKARLEAVKAVADKFPVSTTCLEVVVCDIVGQLSDPKCCSSASAALTALAESARLEHVATLVLSCALERHKSPKVQTEAFSWLQGALTDFGMALNVKAVLSVCKKALGGTNLTVRTACINFLAQLQQYGAGAAIQQALEQEKPAVRQQLQEELERLQAEDVGLPAPTRGLSQSASKASVGSEPGADDGGGWNEEGGGAVESSPPDSKARQDIAPLITEALLNDLNAKSWTVRNEALEKVKNIIQEAAVIKPSVGELCVALAPRLQDANTKISALALQVCEMLVTAVGPRARQYIRTLFPNFFQGLGDSKSWIRAAALQCINVWTAHCGVHAVFEGEMVYDALKSGSPILRAELWAWLADKLPSVSLKQIPREELAVCVPLLYAALEDRGVEVRRAATDAVLGFMMHLGNDAMVRLAEKLKPGSKGTVSAALDKARPYMPVQPLPKAADKGKGAAPAAASKGAPAQAQKGKPVKGLVKSASGTARNKKEEEAESAPLLPLNNVKHQRIIDDQKLKVLKWNFVTPREEFFELLKDQMTTAGLNKTLISNMFHADFRYHIKAIEALIDDLPENGPALIANLDLVLKWLTLRFFDTNPSVLLRGLEYLVGVFTLLINEDYHMAEYEAACFIPYLVLKVGDPKDTVRNGVKSLLKQICIVYSVSKLFGYLMEGLKSKNARQRTECLEVLGLLIESYGVSVCSPSPAAALKEVARQISDRDNSVRNAALNCVVQAYFLEGEKVYKMIGQISDKDHSLLEERIKRAAKGRDNSNRKSMLLPLSATGRPIQPEVKEYKQVEQNVANEEEEEEEEPPNDYPPPPVRVSALSRVSRPVSGPFGLNPSVLASIEDGLQDDISRRPALQEMDLSFLDEPEAAPNINIPRPPGGVVLSPMSRLPMGAPLGVLSPPGAAPSLPLSLPPPAQQQDILLLKTIQAIASQDLQTAVNALSQMDAVLRSHRANLTAADEEQLLLAMAAQLQLLQHQPDKSDTFNAYRYLLTILTQFYEGKVSGCSASVSTIAALVDQLLRLLVSRALERGEADGDDKMVRAVNNVCVKVLERSDHTNLVVALLDLLERSVGGEPASPRYQELEMKCLWKVMKSLPEWEAAALDYDRLMRRLHDFFSHYPGSYWKRNPTVSDTPYRTVKTMVHSLVKKKGSSIMNHLSHIPNVQESEIYAYLLKLFKSLKLEENAVLPPAQPRRELPRLVQEELALILKRIGDKDHSKEALAQLYDLRERHPSVDIWSGLKDASSFFRNYIERGLREVAEERREGRGGPAPPVSMPLHQHLAATRTQHTPLSDGDGNNAGKGHIYYSERLRALRAKIGFGEAAGGAAGGASLTAGSTLITDNRNMSDENLNDKQNIDPKFDLPSLHGVGVRTEPQVDALRQKLQQIKSANR